MAPVQVADAKPAVTPTGLGLDIAALALKRLVSAVLLITGDSDMIPALKFARREGLRVYLHTLGKSVRPALKAHADVILP